MTIKLVTLVTSLYSHDIFFFGFILVDYQTGLWEKYLVTGDWSQSWISKAAWDVKGHLTSELGNIYQYQCKITLCYS